MRSIPPLMAFAGAVAVFAAGYAQGAASLPNPFLNTKTLSSSGLAYVEGPDAEPPPWPANLPAAQEPPAAQVAVATASAPAETKRVAPQERSDTLALNIPSSALNPAFNPPPALAADSAASQEVQKVRPRPRQAMPKQVSFGTTHEGRPVTIIWDR